MGWAIFLVIFAIVGALLVAFVAWVIALSLLHPPRMTDGKAMYVLRRMSPTDIGLNYERVAFEVRDEANPGSDRKLRMAAWWIPHEHANGRCVVMLHGYADAKVGAIAWAPTWHALGFNILAIDLRAHGESEGAHTTGGYFERHDVEQILDQLRAARPNETRQFVLLGMSLGSAVALGVADLRPDLVDAIVLECPFTSFRIPATAHASYLGAPARIVMPLALRIASAISGAKLDDVRPIELMRTLSYPIFIIQSAGDAFVGQQDNEAIVSAVADRPNVKLWRAENAEHLLAIAADPVKYRERLSAFLESSGAQTPHPASPRVRGEE